ncbi:MAG TPA: hypothetical protein VFG50_09445 [Rhodothermales bacterium]|nr:hypothetical protein [Rhodothermales bacterium]
MGLFPPLLVATDSVAAVFLTAPMLAIYLWKSWGRFQELTRVARQLRMEELFLQQNLNQVQLRQCLQHRDHLWSSSLVLQGLRGVLSHPLPHLLTPDERAERLRIYFHRVLFTLRPASLHAEWLLPPVACTTAVLVAGAGHLTDASVLFPISAALSVCFVSLVTAQIVLVRLFRREFTAAELALGDWTQEAKLSNVMLDRRKLYAHTLLYEAQPWFHTHPTRTSLPSD